MERLKQPFEQVYEENMPGIHRYMVVKAGIDEAEDLTQDAFLRAWRAYPRFDPAISPVYHWLTKIALNKYLTSKRIRPSIYIDSLPHVMASRQESPIDAVERRETEQRVRELIATLKPTARQMIELRYFNSLTYEQIARITGKPLGSVKASIFRAKASLRKLVEESGEDI